MRKSYSEEKYYSYTLAKYYKLFLDIVEHWAEVEQQ